MTADRIDCYAVAFDLKAKLVPTRRGGAMPRRRGRVRVNCRLGAAAPATRPAAEALSIEEAIARFVDANPAQLYRGGA
jgi:hypothetical protein